MNIDPTGITEAPFTFPCKVKRVENKFSRRSRKPLFQSSSHQALTPSSSAPSITNPPSMAAVTQLNPPNSLPLSNRRRNHNFRLPSVLSASPNNKVHVNGIDGFPSDDPSLSLRVAFQGSHGAYSEFAAKTAIPNCTTLPCRSFSDTIAAVEIGRADRAILPVESTMEGTSLRNYDLLLRRDLRIAQEISLFVHYCLLAMPGVRTAELRRVISHPMALAHCDRAISQLGLLREPVEDTAGAVQMLRSRRLLDTAAIASPRAALLYGLDVLANGLQDASWNVTRFLLLSKPLPAAAPVIGKAKTSMVVAHRGGSMMVLLKVLSAFSSRNINLAKLEVNNPSIEGQGPVMVLDVRGMGSLRAFPHVIYVDFEGSTEDFKVQEAIDEIAGFSVLVRILGCYAADSKVYDLHY